MNREAWQTTTMGSQRVEQDLAIITYNYLNNNRLYQFSELGPLTHLISHFWFTIKLPSCSGCCNGALSMCKRSYPTSEVRGRSWRTPCPKGGSQEELPHIRGQGQRPRVPGCDSAGTAERSYPIWGQGQQPRGATQVWGQGWRPGGAAPQPRSSGCEGAGGPRGAIPRWRSGRAVVRRYPSSKVRSNGCALLEQPWRDTPCPR